MRGYRTCRLLTVFACELMLQILAPNALHLASNGNGARGDDRLSGKQLLSRANVMRRLGAHASLLRDETGEFGGWNSSCRR